MDLVSDGCVPNVKLNLKNVRQVDTHFDCVSEN